MCGRFVFRPSEAFYERFAVLNRLESPVPRYNIAPGQMVPVIVAPDRQVVLMRWGLVPRWAKDEKTAYKMINARVETLAEKPAFRHLLAANRCLVPASGFYEWQGAGRDKTPYYIHPQGDEFLAFAGLYDTWAGPDGETLQTFTIVTKDADASMARLHHRMPVILPRDLEEAYLAKEHTSPRAVLELFAQSAGVPLEAYPVSRLVNRPSTDSEQLIHPVA
jgi:putative SOS response-associated peptidase YedK